MVFTLLEQPKTSSLFQSLATDAMEEQWRGELVFACSKRVNTILPLQAEAKAIKWALTLAANLEFEAIIIELDSQVCSNLLSDLEAAPLGE